MKRRPHMIWSAFAMATMHLCIGSSCNDAHGGCSLPVDASAQLHDPNHAALLQRKSIRQKQVSGVGLNASGSKHTGLSPEDGESGVGSTASLDDEGYLKVASTKDPRQMEMYMLRLIYGMGLQVQDHAGLLGVIPYYDGEKSFQSFLSMKDEVLRNLKHENSWVAAKGTSVSGALHKSFEQLAITSAASAPLTEDGYHEVAGLRSTPDMIQFVRRVVADLGLCVEDVGGLYGFAMWYSGERDTQSLAHLRAEVINASKYDGTWVLPPPCEP